MDDLFEAIKSNDLVAVRKYFAENIGPVCGSLIEERKIEIARSIMIEGEEPKDDEDEDKDDGKAEKKDKKESDDADEGDDDEDEDDE
ncbi:prohead [Escherichia phage vB_EcoM_RZ]|uniref:Prohead core protein n=1 Tax=Escherichia phage vB_EcoM_RZ TaxID=2893954 RepID=A0AAE9C8V2_9CAUD|nr:prohead [Escherichia phage vB_EcoM_RZ]QMV33804.1 prohead core protein [Escherichia phage DK-13]UGL60024.1 prohead core protein [Escherichia phage vB_EcoM_RZ]